jgi:predicted nucleotidyltransferase
MAPFNLPASLRRVIDRYVRAFAPERIVVFGSYAKGSNRAGSDVDLLIVANVGDDTTWPARRARHLAADSYPPVDVVFASPEDVVNATPSGDPFLISILEVGVTVYRREHAIE